MVFYYFEDLVVYAALITFILMAVGYIVVFVVARNYVWCRIQQQFFGKPMSFDVDIDSSYTFSNPQIKLGYLCFPDRIHKIRPNSVLMGAGSTFLVHKWLGATVTPEYIIAVNKLIDEGYTNFAHVLLDYSRKHHGKDIDELDKLISDTSSKPEQIAAAMERYQQKITEGLVLTDRFPDALTENLAELFKFSAMSLNAYDMKQVSEEEKLTVERTNNEDFWTKLMKLAVPLAIIMFVFTLCVIVLNAVGFIHVDTQTAATTTTTIAQAATTNTTMPIVKLPMLQ